MGSVEDKHHTFFECAVSAGVWQILGFSDVSAMSDEEIWSFTPPPGLKGKLWPFVLLTILWRLWDARNGQIFRGEHFDNRLVIAQICDDFVIRRKCLRNELVNSLNDRRSYFLSCNSVNSLQLAGVTSS